MKKVLFGLNIPSPYRVKFLNHLAKYVDLFVLFERKSSSDRNNKWFDQELSFNHVYMKSFEYGKDKSISFNFLKYINRNFDHIIILGYSSLTLILIMVTLKLMNKKFTLELDGAIYKKQFVLKYLFKKLLLTLPNKILSSSADCDEYLFKYNVNHKKISRYRFSTLFEAEISNNKKYSISFKPKNLLLKSKKKYKLLSIINNHYVKGLDLLINFLNQTKIDFEINIINVTKSNPQLNKMTNLVKSKTKVYEFLSSNKLDKFFSNADFFIFPTRGDVWGIVVYEALSFGTPVISTNKSLAALEFIDSSNGFIIDSIVSNEFNRIVEHKIANFSFIDLNNCYNSIKNHTIENMVNDHLKILND